MMRSIPIVLIILWVSALPVWAGGAMMRRQQMQQQKIMQKRLIQQKIRERQMQQVAQQAREVATRRVIQEQKKTIQKVAVQKAVIQRDIAAAQIQAARQAAAAQQEALKQAAIIQYQTNQQITQAQKKAVQQALLERALQQKAIVNPVQAGYQAGVQVGQKIAYERQRDAQAEEIVSLDQMVTALDESGQPWSLMMDMEAKQAVVAYYIQRYQEQGVVIAKSPDFYAKMIDAMSAGAPQMLDNPFPRVLQVVAIMEYDFDNGYDKDAMARQILGEEGYRNNRQRLGLP